MKNKLNVLIGILIGFVFSICATYLTNANEVGFTPSVSDWNVSTVEEAINDLYTNASECKKMEGTVYPFSYTGNYQTFIVPCTGEYRIELWGASGKYTSYTAAPGKGGYVSGYIDLNKDTKLYVYVGESGNITSSNYNVMSFNGGGYTHSTSSYYGRGGGATDVRLVDGTWNNFESLKSRIIVAGGGGSGHNSAENIGGNAGGLTSYFGNGSGGGTVATQTSGYAFGYGGPGLAGQAYSASGGGYYGGKSSTTQPCTLSAGGSSFISGHAGCNAISESSTSSNIIHTGQSIHYSNYKFEKTNMIDGAGYSWTNTKGNDTVGMPTYDGLGTMIGNIGNGYAKITFISID